MVALVEQEKLVIPTTPERLPRQHRLPLRRRHRNRNIPPPPTAPQPDTTDTADHQASKTQTPHHTPDTQPPDTGDPDGEAADTDADQHPDTHHTSYADDQDGSASTQTLPNRSRNSWIPQKRCVTVDYMATRNAFSANGIIRVRNAKSPNISRADI